MTGAPPFDFERWDSTNELSVGFSDQVQDPPSRKKREEGGAPSD